jgi:hypothetical protein
MSKAEGIYLSADYRVTDARTGKLIDDASVKHLRVDYPPDQAGPKALMAFTGLARLRDGTPTRDVDSRNPPRRDRGDRPIDAASPRAS